MDVPFISSGATNRAHYSLVRQVESASSIQSANQHLSAEVKSIRRQLSQPKLPLESCRECLIILLYCHITITHGVLPHNAFDFALSHATSLAEAGRTISQKRIGYLYCVEVMPTHHELQLMLVNTLRKDLEHENVARICLALEVIIASPTEDIIPAIQHRLHDILSHTSPHVRRRALAAFHVLSRHYQELSTQFTRNVTKLLDDPDTSVIQAALIASIHLPKFERNLKTVLNNLLKAKVADELEHGLLLTIIHNLFHAGLTDENVPAVLTLIHSSSKSKDYPMLQGAFLLLSKVTTTILLSSMPSSGSSPVSDIRSFLVSLDPNHIYLFLSCLGCLDPSIWAGTSPDSPAVLESWEVEHIMRLLESTDSLIRRKTLRILNRVDAGIVASYKIRAIAAIPHGLSIADSNECAYRLLEVVDIQSSEDGELYAREAKEALAQLEAARGSTLPVLEAAVEMILMRVRHADSSFRIACAATLVTVTIESGSQLPQSIVVIAAALSTELCGQLAISPRDILKGFAAILPLCVASIQDACLLAMLRVAAECNELSPEIVDAVMELGKQSGRHIRRRCEQFVELMHQKSVLIGIIANARSSSIPDFLIALQDHVGEGTTATPAATRSSSSQSLVGSSQLRYKAYDTPSPAPKLRLRRRTSSRSKQASSMGSFDPLSRTLTPGQLSIVAAGGQGLEAMESSKLNLEERMDLISLDQTEFEVTWESNGDSEVGARAAGDGV